MVELHFGSPVTGAQRFPRPELEARLMRDLESCAGIKMFGLRRIGKSTLRLYAMEQLEQAQRPFAFIDAQGSTSLGDFLTRLAQAIPGESGFVARVASVLNSAPAKSVLSALLKSEDFKESTLSAHWQVVSNAVIETLRGEGENPVLIVDEFPFLIDNLTKDGSAEGVKDANKLLASMREWRGEGMTMLLTGSIGLTGIARTRGLNLEHLNDLKRFAVPELTEEQARAFIAQATEKASKGLWSQAHTEAFMQEVGVLYPCFIVAGLMEVNLSQPADPAAFPDIFAEQVRPDLHHTFFHQFDRRFKAYNALPNGEQRALYLPALKAVLASQEPRCQGDLTCAKPYTPLDLDLALETLADDGFIHFAETAEGDRLWRPASRLAKLWWKRARLA